MASFDAANSREMETGAPATGAESTTGVRDFPRHDVDFHRGAMNAMDSTQRPSLRNEEVKALVGR